MDENIKATERGRRLAEERKRLGFGQGSLAEQLGISLNTQSLYERGLREPNTSYVQQAAALGMDMGYVINGIRSTAGSGIQLRSRLVDVPETCVSDVLADYWQILASQLEQSMLQAGGVPNQDYTLKDLYQLTQPLVVARLNELRIDLNEPKGLGLRSDDRS